MRCKCVGQTDLGKTEPEEDICRGDDECIYGGGSVVFCGDDEGEQEECGCKETAGDGRGKDEVIIMSGYPFKTISQV